MADDARISIALPRHPKTVKLQRRLGTPGCWSLVCLFLWVAENHSDGDLEGMTDEDIEIAAGWTGDVGEFTRSLAEVRFLDGPEGSYKVHDWSEHNPWAANRGRRIEAAKSAASTRWERGAAGSKQIACDPHATRMRTASDSHANSNADSMPTTQPNPTQPHHTTKLGVAPAEWIPTDPWAGFLEMRKKIRKPPTDRAIALIVKQLERLRDDGHDPGAVLDQSTRNNWQDVFPVKGTNGNGNGSENRAERRQARNIAAREEAVEMRRRMAS